MRSRLASWAGIALALVAFLASVWVGDRYLERLPHIEDEFALLWEAHVMAQGEISVPSPAEADAFLVPFVVDYHGSRFAKYAPGWSAALSLGVRAGPVWLVNPLLAGLATWLVYRLGTKVSGHKVGLLAALLFLVSPTTLMLSGSLMSHMFSVVLSLAFLLAWLDLFPSSRDHSEPKPTVPPWLRFSVAGLALGLLALTRPLTAIGVGLPCLFYALVLLVRGPGTQRKRALAVAGIALATASLLPLWNAALTGNPLLNLYSLWWDYDGIGFGPGVGRGELGHTFSMAMINARYSLRSALHDVFGWPYLSWVFLPFGVWALRRSRDGLLSLATFPSLVLVHMAYWVGSWLLGPRYYYEGIPGLAITSAAGIFWLGGWLAKPVRAVRLRRLALTATLLILLSLNLAFYLPARLSGLRGLYGISRAAMAPVEEFNLQSALLIVHPLESWTDYGSLLTLSPPFTESNLLVVRSRGAKGNALLQEAYPNLPAYHYYPDEPHKLYNASRTDSP